VRYWHFRLFRRSLTIMAVDMPVEAAGMAAVVIGTVLAGTVGVAAGIIVVTVGVGELDPR
jgi:hypothetical protein